ncbi:cytochrome C and quinol oxidase polypeptide I [Desulfosporosinus fructosivorans]|uniref:Cytochrome C and quinol oxidase polypeptide I n=1 Tax=Desulfosporosinus fructosivorans TaxID=2018669 RepID=A0A4Z0R469_9FIRM|nr:cbb3-type cytochrome c oxidase subunit I [Desulfosporosinus fructosivorans]TGE36416.1 cytochrome C and quinol oxidase polypeptide I [Desulfosporosinus fructosivorans]
MKLSQWVHQLFGHQKRRGTATSPSNATSYYGQQISRRYCLAAVSLFTLQGIVALLGAVDLIIPDLPSPIPFEYGRAVHLGLAVLWPLIGTMGIAYYSVVQEVQSDIYSPKIARWQLWLVLFFSFSLYATLSLRIGNGREYFEGLPLIYLGISLSIALGAYNLLRTLISAKSRITPAAAITTAGICSLFLFLIPNIFTYQNPIADEAVKFWLVHLWEELAFELTTAGFISYFYVLTGIASKSEMQRWLYLEATLTVVAGFFGTAHHYYWIGFPAYWLLLGLVFSISEVIPVFLLVFLTYKGLKKHPKLNLRLKLSLWFILSSLIHNLIGASLLGLLISVPQINLYMHGTYLTSGHAHLALFGALGFLVLGGIYHVLSQGSEPTSKDYKTGVIAILLLNIGLLTMGLSLIIAGFIQAYLWRMLGMDFVDVHALIQPYLIIRALGGSLFTLGDLIFGRQVYKVWKKTTLK